MTTGALYKWYKGKEDLLCTMVDQTVKDLYKVAHAKGDRGPAAMPGVELMKAWAMDGPDMMWWMRFLFDRHDGFILLLSRSDETRYANFQHDGVGVRTKPTGDFLWSLSGGVSTGRTWGRKNGIFCFPPSGPPPMSRSSTALTGSRCIVCMLFDWHKALRYRVEK